MKGDFSIIHLLKIQPDIIPPTGACVYITYCQTNAQETTLMP